MTWFVYVLMSHDLAALLSLALTRCVPTTLSSVVSTLLSSLRRLADLHKTSSRNYAGTAIIFIVKFVFELKDLGLSHDFENSVYDHCILELCFLLLKFYLLNTYLVYNPAPPPLL